MREPRSPIVGRSNAAQKLRRDIEKFAPMPYPVLIVGETGTGKELAARELHRQSGRKGAFVPVNCSCLPESVLDSELFGHARGAFTGAEEDRPGLFEAADEGTLFLDELETLSPAGQERLLRVVETGRIRPVGDTAWRSIGVRLLAATNENPVDLLDSGRLRADLFYRLGVLEIRIPPLRERRDDLPLLVEHVLKRVAAETGREPGKPTEELLRRLHQRDWPGNVRELENLLRRTVIASTDGSLCLPGPEPVSTAGPARNPLSLENHARRVFEKSAGVVPLAQIARDLGISRKTLWAWRRKWRNRAPVAAASADPLASAS